ncbi:MAG: DegT/DnrJ/EryC1/StrS family aminotransferase [Pseudomonadota bacterium]
MIPLATPLEQFRAHRSAITAAVTRVLEGGGYILGKEVESFETEFARYCGTRHAIGLNSGTDALVLGLKALGVKAGDKVVTVAHTALATIAATIATGATPVLVDVDPATHTLDVAKLASALDPSVRAIVAVHLYGNMADLPAILAIAGRNGIPVIEDCAQSTGAKLGGKRAGSMGALGCFSFYPTKNLGAIGDGGMLVTNDAALATRVARLRQYGWDAGRATEEPGFNSRLDPLQAAILGVKLPHLDADNTRRIEIASRYSMALQGLPLKVPAARADAAHVFHLYVVECDDRDALRESLQRAEIQSAVHYTPATHQQGGYDRIVVKSPGGLAVTEKLVGRILSLPMYPELTDAQVDAVIAAVQRHYARAG